MARPDRLDCIHQNTFVVWGYPFLHFKLWSVPDKYCILVGAIYAQQSRSWRPGESFTKIRWFLGWNGTRVHPLLWPWMIITRHRKPSLTGYLFSKTPKRNRLPTFYEGFLGRLIDSQNGCPQKRRLVCDVMVNVYPWPRKEGDKRYASYKYCLCNRGL